MGPKDHLFDQLKQAGRSIMEGQQVPKRTTENPELAGPKTVDPVQATTATETDLLSHLIREAGEHMKEARRMKLEELGMSDLTVDMFHYVEVIASLENPNASAIAKALDLTRPSVTAILNKLETRGILEKEKDRNDARAVRIRLTPVGTSIAESCRAADRDFAQRMSKQLEPGEFMVLVHLMAKGMGRDIPFRE